MSDTKAISVEAAQAQVDAARLRLSATVEEIQLRINPRTLLDEAITEVRTRSSDLAQTAADTVREQPAVVAAGAASVGLVLFRKPLGRLFRKITGRTKETPAPARRSPRKLSASEGPGR